jgi:hypothetical protein
LVVEAGRGQAQTLAEVVVAAGMSASIETDDEIGGTVVLGRG